MRIALCLSWAAFCAAPPCAHADDEATAVYSKVVSKDYVRMKLADGSYRPEEYFLKNGGRYDQPSGDTSMDSKTFADIARVIVEQLGAQSYHPGTDPEAGKLIIVVFWGTSITLDPTMSFTLLGPDFVNFVATMQAVTDAKNAGLLGYDWTMMSKQQIMRSNKTNIELNELQFGRYFVVLMAYDCHEFLKHKKYKELWETRFSISTHNTDFTRALPKMARDASGYFGRDSHGLQYIPEGQVHVGELRSLGPVPEK
jgi:hypothetical protein